MSRLELSKDLKNFLAFVLLEFDCEELVELVVEMLLTFWLEFPNTRIRSLCEASMRCRQSCFKSAASFSLLLEPLGDELKMAGRARRERHRRFMVEHAIVTMQCDENEGYIWENCEFVCPIKLICYECFLSYVNVNIFELD